MTAMTGFFGSISGTDYSRFYLPLICPARIRPMNLQQTDPKIAELIKLEEHRQESTLELIASENHVSRAVQEAAGTVLTNKYAEGYPGARYYGGWVFYKHIETFAMGAGQTL